AVQKGLSLVPNERYPSLEALLAALSGDPQRRRRQRAAGIGVAVGAAALMSAAAYAFLTRADRLCTGAPALVDAVWNPTVAHTIETAFASSGFDGADANWQLTHRALDAWWQSWVAMHTDACRATRVRGEQSDQLLSLRMACLARRRAQAVALLEV